MNLRLPNYSSLRWAENYDRTFGPVCDGCKAKVPATLEAGDQKLCLTCYAKAVNAAADDFRENGR